MASYPRRETLDNVTPTAILSRGLVRLWAVTPDGLRSLATQAPAVALVGRPRTLAVVDSCDSEWEFGR